MASKAIAALGSERTEAKRAVWDVAIDGIATWRWQAHPSCSTTASAQCTYLEAPQSPPCLIQLHHLKFALLHQWHHLFLCWRLVCLPRTFKPVITQMKKITTLGRKMKGSRISGAKLQIATERERGTHMG